MSDKSSPKNVKKRNWAFVAYPESMPEDFFERLNQSGIPCAVSPLHDKDMNANGEPKKPHYHIILCYEGPTTFNAVSKFTESVGGTIPQPLESIKGYYRYLTHKDNPEKAQYNECDIKHLNGFNPRDFIEISKSEVLALIKHIQNIVRDAEIYEYSDLLDLLLDSDMVDEYDVATSHTLLLKGYIDSRRNKVKDASAPRNTERVRGGASDDSEGVKI